MKFLKKLLIVIPVFLLLCGCSSNQVDTSNVPDIVFIKETCGGWTGYSYDWVTKDGNWYSTSINYGEVSKTYPDFSFDIDYIYNYLLTLDNLEPYYTENITEDVLSIKLNKADYRSSDGEMEVYDGTSTTYYIIQPELNITEIYYGYTGGKYHGYTGNSKVKKLLDKFYKQDEASIILK